MPETKQSTPSNETRGNIEVGKHYEIKDPKLKEEFFEKYKKYVAGFMKTEELRNLDVNELRITVSVDLWNRDAVRRFKGKEAEQLSCEVKVI